MTAPRELPPTSAFAGDDGSCDPRLADALRALGDGRGSLAGVVAALAGTRVLVPVLAELEAADVVEHGGHQHTVDKEASAGIVALQAPDGRTALPVFSSVAAMQAWRPDARPVPTDVARAALSAVEERWELLVLDPGGPVTVLVPRPAVWALAQQREWVPAVRRALGAGGAGPSGAAEPTGATDDREVDPDVRAALRAALGAVPEVLGVDARPGRRAEVAVLLRLVPGLDRARLDGVLGRVNAALAADETVTLRVDSLELRLLAG